MAKNSRTNKYEEIIRQEVPVVTNATIAAAGNLSSAANIVTSMIFGLKMPAAWTAADITFQVSLDNVTYQNLYDETGTEVKVVVAASRFVRLPPGEWASYPYIKIRSGTAAAPVAQVAEAIIGIASASF